MANSDLLGETIDLPDEVIKVLNRALKLFGENTDSQGYKRAKFLLNKKQVTYEQLKRIKNYFDKLTPDDRTKPSFFLNGGFTMQKWVEFILKQMRQDSNLRKKVLKNSGIDNAYKDMENSLDGLKAYNFRKDNITRTDTIKPKDVNSIMNEEIDKIKYIYNYNPKSKNT